MSTKQEHLDFIAVKGKFNVDCKQDCFSTDEIEILERYGHWFNALTSGELQPISDTQQRFIVVANGKEDPFSLEEVAWWKYLDQKAFELRHKEGKIIQYHVQDDTFYNRKMVKKVRSTMYKVMKDNHKNS